MSLSQCSENIREKEKYIYFSPGLGTNPTKSLVMTQPGWPAAARGGAWLPRCSPAPIPRGPAGAKQDGPRALQGLQPKGKFGLEQTHGWPRRIPLLVLPAHLEDRRKGEAMKVKPQSVHVVTSPSFAHL